MRVGAIISFPSREQSSIEPVQLVGEVDRALEELPEAERQVLRQRFGVGDRVHGLDEVGRSFGVSPGRVRQLQERALGNLRANAVRHSAAARRKDVI